MKVIKYGNLPEEKVYKAECDYCHTVVEFQAWEIKRTEHTMRNETYLVVLCPLCDKEIWADK